MDAITARHRSHIVLVLWLLTYLPFVKFEDVFYIYMCSGNVRKSSLNTPKSGAFLHKKPSQVFVLGTEHIFFS